MPKKNKSFIFLLENQDIIQILDALPSKDKESLESNTDNRDPVVDDLHPVEVPNVVAIVAGTRSIQIPSTDDKGNTGAYQFMLRQKTSQINLK